jgi:polysaccharide pyruvyl transferase WcaK-like protein
MRIFMTGEDGLHNMGDEGQALASAVRLKQYFPTAELVATGFDPLGSVLRHQARIVPWPLTTYDLRADYLINMTRRVGRKLGASEEWLDPVGRKMDAIFQEQYRGNECFRSVLTEIENSDFIFDMGHGALNDVFDPFMLCFLYYVAGRLNKPLFISGQSIGPFWRKRTIRMLRETLTNAHTTGLRDKDVSRQILLDEVGVDPQRVHLVEIGDDTLDLAPREPCWDSFSPVVAAAIRSGRFIAIHWRASDYTQTLNATERIVALAEAIKRACAITGLPAVFLPFSWETHSSDSVTAASIHDYLQGQAPFYAAWNYLEAAELKWMLGQARFGIGLSYHFNVFLLSQGRPAIGLFSNDYYKVKLTGAFRAYGYQASPLPYNSGLATAPAFETAVETVSRWSDADVENLKTSAETLRLAWHRAFQSFIRDKGLQA